MNTDEDRPDPKQLLEAFVASGGSGTSFVPLVEGFSSLVYSSALRRTGDPPLAEEITQNVFAILARKARSLRSHPSLRAWVLETTRLQAASAMRVEQRRRRKMDALANEAERLGPELSSPMDDAESWKDAVPHLDQALDRLSEKERDVVVQRFYEGKRFKEIAFSNGETEGACKKRLQRTIEKLSRLLTARGVALPATALASALTAELARAAPAQTATVVSSKALAASSSLTSAALLSNTLQTMSHTKTVAVTATTILALAAIPIAQQRAEGQRLQSELDALSVAAAVTESGAASRSANVPDGAGAGRVGRQGARNARSLLAALDGPPNNRGLIRSMVTGDTLDETVALARINTMSSEEINALLREIKRFPIDDFLKSSPLSEVDRFAPDQSPRARLDRMVAGGFGRSRRTALFDWALSEPDAAVAWYREKRASGELYPGLKDDLHEDLIGDLLYGLSESSPAQALELYRQVPRREMNGAVPRNMASGLAKGIMESGDETVLVEMLDYHEGEDRKRILMGAFGEFARGGRFDEGLALVDRHNAVPGERADYLEYLLRSGLRIDAMQSGEMEAGMDWVLSKTQDPEVMQRMAYAFAKRDRPTAQKWADRQETGMVRDVTHAAVADRMSTNSDYRGAFRSVEGIDDPALRAETRRLVEQRWREDDRERAKQDLPAELLQQLQSQ